MKIANIVSTSPVTFSDDFNVVESMDDIIHGLPTLIIGFDIADKLYPNYDVTEIKICKDVYWTTKKSEDRDKQMKELEWFKFHVYSELFSKVNYLFVDPIQYRKKTILKIFRKIYNLSQKVVYVHGDMVYIYGDFLIFGVDLKLLRFMGVDCERILTKIKALSSVFLRDEDIFIEYKNIIDEFGNQIRFVPYLYSIKNEQNNITSVIHLT
jgi:hypothetical protein